MSEHEIKTIEEAEKMIEALEKFFKKYEALYNRYKKLRRENRSGFRYSSNISGGRIDKMIERVIEKYIETYLSRTFGVSMVETTNEPEYEEMTEEDARKLLESAEQH